MNDNKKVLNNRLNKALVVEILATIGLYLGYLLAYNIFNVVFGLVIGLLLTIILLCLTFYKKYYSLIGISNSFATGIIIGGYFSDQTIDNLSIIKIILSICIVILIINLLVRVIPIRRTFMIIIDILLFIIVIYFVGKSKSLVYEHLIFFYLFLLFMTCGLTHYIFKGKSIEESLLGSLFLAFIIIFIIIIIILSEGDGLDGLTLDIGGGKSKRKRKPVSYQ